MSEKLQNLDRLCAEYGYQMAYQVWKALDKKNSDAENLITKSLGVLQEDGVYAFFLYLASQIKPSEKGKEEGKKSQAARALANQAASFLSHDGLKLLQADGTNDAYRNAMEQIRAENGLASNLDNLLLAKRLLEKALIYARYHAKAMEEKK